MSEPKRALRQKIADRAAREPHEVIADAIRKAGQDIAAQLGESFGPLREVRVVTDGKRDVDALTEAIGGDLRKTFETREEALKREIRDRVLELCGFTDGGEVTADGSAGNDLAGERADAIMKIIEVVRGSNWPEGYVPLETDAAPEKRLQAIRQHLIHLCKDRPGEAGEFQRASERADVVMAVASLARTHPDPKRLLPDPRQPGEWLPPGTPVLVHLGGHDHPAVVEPRRDMVTVRLAGSGVVTEFPRVTISKEGEPWTPPKPTES